MGLRGFQPVIRTDEEKKAYLLAIMRRYRRRSRVLDTPLPQCRIWNLLRSSDVIFPYPVRTTAQLLDDFANLFGETEDSELRIFSR